MTQQEIILKQCERSGVSVVDLLSQQRAFNRKEPDVRDYLTDTLHSLLCERYALSRHTNKQKLIDLVVEELNI